MSESIRADELLVHAGFLRALTRALLDPDEVDDVVQETMLAAVRRPPRDRTKLRSWLASVARRLAMRRRRSEARQRSRMRAAIRRDAQPSTASVAAELELQRMAVEAVMALDEPSRSAVVFRYLHDMKPAEIARRLDVPVRTVESRLRRGLRNVRSRLDSHTDRHDWRAGLAALAWPSAASAKPGAVAAVLLLCVGVTTWHAGIRDPAPQSRRTVTAKPPARVVHAPRQKASSQDELVFSESERKSSNQEVPGVKTKGKGVPANVARLHVIVLDGRGVPVRGLAVRVAKEETRRTNDQGETTWDLKRGHYEVSLERPGHTRRCMLVKGHKTQLRFVLDAVVQGVVYRDDGEPAAELELVIEGDSTVAVQTSDRGHYAVLGLPPGRYEAILRKAGGGFVWHAGCVYVTGATTTRDLNVGPTMIAGRVVRENGQEFSGSVGVGIRMRGTNRWYEARIAKGGRYELRGFPPGSYEMRARCYYFGYAPTERDLELDNNGPRDGIDFVVSKRRYGMFVLQLLDSDGKAVEGASVSVKTQEGAWRYVEAKEIGRGEYEIKLEAGVRTLRINHYRRSKLTRIANDTLTVTNESGKTVRRSLRLSAKPEALRISQVR